jgi:hypothetical protein
MRLTILAGLMVGVSLAIQSAHLSHLKAKVSQPSGVVIVHVIAPWYMAMNPEQSPFAGDSFAARRGSPGKADSVAS